MSWGLREPQAARDDSVVRDRPWATSAPTPSTCSPLPWQINVLQAKKKFEILDSVSDW